MFAEFKDTLLTYGLSFFGRYYSLYQGEVVDNEDPEFVGRIKLKCAKIAGDQVIDTWAFPRGMNCGKGIGLFAIPNKGDVVWVSFLEGDPAHPIWEYGWFGRGDITSNIKNNGNKPTNTVWQTTSGHRIELDDKSGSEAVRVYSKHDHGVEINTNGVSVIAPSGKHIYLGGLNAAAEPGVLGDKNADALTEIKDTLQDIVQLLTQIATADAAGTAMLLTTYGVTLNYVSLITSALSGLGADIGNITAKIPPTKSQKIKLD